ncbi:MAG: metal ABC transporter ATP-binding protein [Candidatus Riflebacteria bacterium]|nr:metal ABC transporter ATP-binding protein [Candidatus Riflebacteria bacterium]
MAHLPDSIEPKRPDLILNLTDVRMGYGRRTVLDGVRLSLLRGDYLGMVGPNGSGKTTLLLGMMGVLRPLAGKLERIAPLRVGYVPQRNALDEVFPLTARDIVRMGLEMDGMTHADSPDVALVLEEVGLAGLGERWYRELSGGQKQRVLLARALVSHPDLLILDEPTNGLDYPAEASIMSLVDGLHSRGRTIVLVTHHLNLVANHARTLALVGDGRVVTGAREELLTGARLAAIYGTGVRVVEVDGRRVVLPGEEVAA